MTTNNERACDTNHEAVVLKIQWPIVSSSPNPCALMYNKRRTIEVELPCSTPGFEEWYKKQDPDNRYKIYVRVKPDKSGGLMLSNSETIPFEEWPSW